MLKNKALLMASAVMMIASPISADDHQSDIIENAVKNENRTARLVKNDPQRKPADILRFAGVKSGMKVLDINSGSGYYTEILANIVGTSGKVWAHNGPIYWDFMGDQTPKNLAGRANVDNVYKGTEVMDFSSPRKGQLKQGIVDMAFVINAYHDYYFKHRASKGESVADINKSIFDALKSGGTLIVIDHVGVEGASDEDISKIHRIDPKKVRRELEAAGFKFVEESKLLHKADNPPDKSWFGAKIPFNTDRFVYKFMKP